MQQSSHAAALRHPIRTLIVCWAAWKALLLLVALSTPGRGYDSSTSLVLAHAHAHAHAHRPLPQPGPLPAALHAIASKLTRWDAIYFTQAAARGYRFEQEWAFGWGFTRLIALLTASKCRAFL
jgi:phosphatidylinositol glycan class V